MRVLTYGGMVCYVSPLLPLPVSPREEARRIVRHGYADVLAWLGEEIGPKPADQVHVILGVDPANPLLERSGVAFVSPAMWQRLEAETAKAWGAA